MKTKYFLLGVVSIALIFLWDVVCIAMFEKNGWRLERPFFIGTWTRPTGTFIDHILIGFVFLPIVEEVLFRMPLFVVRRESLWVRSFFLILTSFLFGYLHGGIFQTLHKMTGGIILGISFLYIARVSNNLLHALFIATLIHSVGNMVIHLYLRSS